MNTKDNKPTSVISWDLSIVIPAYREAKRIGQSLDNLAGFMTDNAVMQPLNVEIIVVSADSDDDTHAIVHTKASKFKQLRLLTPGPKVGKGRDVRVGMLAAKGKAVLFMDADLATPLEHIVSFYQLYLSGCDIVAATRNLRRHHPQLWRRVLSVTGNILFRILCGTYTEDSQCGFKLFSRKAARLCFSRLTINGWGFDMEVLTIASIHGLSITNVRIDDWKSVPGGSFTDSILKNMTVSLAELLYISYGRISGRYKA
jgi:dolichyl-phosphate beta-glucosyltransferase